jgi:HlyD family secretion protein
MSKIRIAVISVAAVAAAGALTWAFWPEPVPVDLATVERGTDGGHRVGQWRDAHPRHLSGDGADRRHDDALARRSRRRGRRRRNRGGDDPAGRAGAARRARPRAGRGRGLRGRGGAAPCPETNVARAEADLDHAQSQFERTSRLAEQGTIPLRMRDDAALQLRTVESALEAARTDVDRQEATLAAGARATARPEGEGGTPAPGECCVQIHAPASGSVLSIENVSAGSCRPANRC